MEEALRRPSSLCKPTLSPLNLRREAYYFGQYTERTPGSFIEERGASIRWRYWPGNPDDSELAWARRQAAEAQNHIWDSFGEKFGKEPSGIQAANITLT